MSFFSNAEEVIKKHGELGLESLEYYYGLDIEIYRQVKEGPYSRVHGRNSGKEGSYVDTFLGMVAGDDFFPSDDHYTGGFELGFLFTRSDAPRVGDTLKIKSKDGKQRRYRIESLEDIGLTTSIFKKYKLANLGD